MEKTMANNFKQPGDVMDLVNTGSTTIDSGDVVVVGNRCAVALVDIAPGKAGTAGVTGVWLLPKASAGVFAQGAALYWDATNKVATATADGHVSVGYAFSAAAAGEVVVEVKLNA
jgi:predicted RecA/RadA family phage recombinase